MSQRNDGIKSGSFFGWEIAENDPNCGWKEKGDDYDAGVKDKRNFQ